MDTPTSRLIEEAVAAIKGGELSLANGPDRYGSTWVEIEPQVRLILVLHKAGQKFKSELPVLDLNSSWGKIAAQLVQPTVGAGAADSGSNPLPDDPLNLPEMTPATDEANPVRVDLATKSGIKLPNWRRKAFSWAAAFVLFLTLAFTTLAGVAQAAEPGDNLYGVKVWLDGAGQTFAFSDEKRTEAALYFAEHRLTEIEQATRHGRLQYVAVVAARYDAAIKTARQSSKNNWTPAQLRIIAQQQTRLKLIEATLPPEPTAQQVQNVLDQSRQELAPLVSPSPAQPTIEPSPSPQPTLLPTAQPGPAVTSAQAEPTKNEKSQYLQPGQPGDTTQKPVTTGSLTPTPVPTPQPNEQNGNQQPATPNKDNETTTAPPTAGATVQGSGDNQGGGQNSGNGQGSNPSPVPPTSVPVIPPVPTVPPIVPTVPPPPTPAPIIPTPAPVIPPVPTLIPTVPPIVPTPAPVKTAPPVIPLPTPVPVKTQLPLPPTPTPVKTEPPKKDPPKTEPPKKDPPKTEPVKTEPPKKDPPKTDPPKKKD